MRQNGSAVVARSTDRHAMRFLETPVIFASIPFVLVVAGLVLFGFIEVVIGRNATRRFPAGFFAIAPSAPVFAMAVAFLEQTARAEPEVIHLAAATGRGAAALLWSAIIAAGTLVLTISMRERVGHQNRFVKALLVAALSSITASLGLTIWNARFWLPEISPASWALVIVGSLCAFGRKSRFQSPLQPRSDLERFASALVLGWAATAWQFLATASRFHVFGDRESLVLASSTMTLIALWSGAALIIFGSNVLRRSQSSA